MKTGDRGVDYTSRQRSVAGRQYRRTVRPRPARGRRTDRTSRLATTASTATPTEATGFATAASDAGTATRTTTVARSTARGLYVGAGDEGPIVVVFRLITSRRWTAATITVT